MGNNIYILSQAYRFIHQIFKNLPYATPDIGLVVSGAQQSPNTK